MSGTGDEPRPPIALIPGGGTRDQRAEILRTMAATNWEEEERVAQFMARWKKTQFDALLKSGFSQEQALALVK